MPVGRPDAAEPAWRSVRCTMPPMPRCRRCRDGTGVTDAPMLPIAMGPMAIELARGTAGPRARAAGPRARAREREASSARSGARTRDRRSTTRATARCTKAAGTAPSTNFTRVIEMKGPRPTRRSTGRRMRRTGSGSAPKRSRRSPSCTKSYPSSRYLKEAKALEVEVRGAPAAGAPRGAGGRRSEAHGAQALRNSDPAQAIPMLEKLLNGTGSPRLKDQALFVLAQSNTPRAREVLTNIAKGSSTPELQSRPSSTSARTAAPRAAPRSPRSTPRRPTSTSSAGSCARSWSPARRIALLTAAQTEQTPSCARGRPPARHDGRQRRALADVSEGIVGGREEADHVGHARRAATPTRMIELAKTEKNPELRRVAVRNLGVMGAKTAGDALVEIYGTDKDPEIRRGRDQRALLAGQRDGARRARAQGGGHRR